MIEPIVSMSRKGGRIFHDDLPRPHPLGSSRLVSHGQNHLYQYNLMSVRVNKNIVDTDENTMLSSQLIIVVSGMSGGTDFINNKPEHVF